MIGDGVGHKNYVDKLKSNEDKRSIQIGEKINIYFAFETAWAPFTLEKSSSFLYEKKILYLFFYGT